jgi:hypothetical protein
MSPGKSASVYKSSPLGCKTGKCPSWRLFVQVESFPLEISEHYGVLKYLSSRSRLQYLASDTRRTSESDPKSSPQSV